jgi:coenzyme F420-0:L-glutamate ligase/coenzyme F420-1:gamma-L-glutamate ligase
MALVLLPIPGLPRVRPGDDLAALLADAIAEARVGVRDDDVLVVCQKVVSKAEGRVVALATVEPSALARTWAQACEKDPRLIELVLRESARVVRMDGGNLIVETKSGWVCANAGIDQSNAVDEDSVTLLPVDADASAARLRAALGRRLGADLAVIVTDTFGRPWRHGQIEFAIGAAGIEPLLDLRGCADMNGRELGVTVLATVDALAAAAGLLMGKAAGIGAVLVRGSGDGVARRSDDGPGARSLVRPRETDLFR